MCNTDLITEVKVKRFNSFYLQPGTAIQLRLRTERQEPTFSAIVKSNEGEVLRYFYVIKDEVREGRVHVEEVISHRVYLQILKT